MITKATLDDIDAIGSLIQEFYDECISKFNLSFKWETLQNTIRNYIENQIVLLLKENNETIGIIAGLVSPSIFDNTQLIAQETIWYIKKEYRKGINGIKLLKEFEKECKEKGAKLVMMVYMNDFYSELSKIYEDLGYKQIEFHYIKEI